jgi:uncharacterized protein YbjT (DUF2867 family)
VTASSPAGSQLTIAVSGATGFVGRHLLREFGRRGIAARVLARNPSAVPAVPGQQIVTGHLGDPAALRTLTDGAIAVVHLAGVIAAADRAAFRAANVDGTAALLAATPGTACFIHVSSLAAREPDVSVYAASKRESEELVCQRAQSRLIVRPPAVYGPEDRATLPIFRQLARGLLMIPSRLDARFSLIYVEDLARLLADLAAGDRPDSELIEPDDGKPGGYTWPELAGIAGATRRAAVRFRRIPPSLAYPIAAGSECVQQWFGWQPLLTRDKLRELAYPNWVCRPPHGSATWQPQVRFPQGAAATLAWYRDQGWL